MRQAYTRILILILALCALPLHAKSSKELRQMPAVKIWAGTKCPAKGVTMTPYLAGENSPAVIVCPGGSYFWLDEQNEGVEVAKWLQSEGISAFVLRYRTGGGFSFATGSRVFIGGHHHPDMLCDLQRAIQLLRENCEEYGIDPGKLGVMGFSAGGHLVMSAGEYFGTNFLERYKIYPEVSLRPDFCAPIYPVVSMSDKCTHARSRRGLLGEWKMNNKVLRDSLSLEKHVKPTTPPVFLLNCVDDPIVDYHNSELLDSALTAQNIPHLYTKYMTGGHGFGADTSRQNQETSHWQQLFISWFRKLFL